jgi:hypothetical protein
MNESSSFTGAGATGSDGDGGGGAIVVLESVWWKNPFLWMALGFGIFMTYPAVVTDDTGQLQGFARGAGAATVVFTVLAHLALRSRLEIRPDGFREKHSIWRTIEHRWDDVGGFMVRGDDPEAVDAVGFWVRKNGKTHKFDILMGAYADNVKTLTDRMNAARDQALGTGGRTARAPSRERQDRNRTTESG